MVKRQGVDGQTRLNFAEIKNYFYNFMQRQQYHGPHETSKRVTEKK